MKKAFFNVAIVAAGLFVASCGNKSGNSAEAADSTTVAEQPEATPAEETKAETAETLPTGPCTIEFDMFSVDVPEGWKVLKQEVHELKIGTGTDYYNDEQMRFEEHTYQKLDDELKVWKTLEQVKNLGTLKFGPNSFFAIESPTPDLTLAIKGNDKDEYAKVDVSRAAYKGETYKQILSSIKMKQLK